MKGASGNWVLASIATVALLARPAAASDPLQAPTDEPASGPPSCQTSHECAAREGYGRVCVDGRCLDYIDDSDLLNLFKLTPKQAPPPTPFKLYPAIIPAIGYNPALGFLLGVVGNFGMYLGQPDDTTISSANALVLVTTNSQLVIQLGTTLMSARNEWELQGDWRFLLYNQDTYGLGTAVPPLSSGVSIDGWGSTAPLSGGQPMKFNMIRFNELVLHRAFAEHLYLGGSFRYGRYYDIVDENLNLAASPPVVTYNYAYNVVEGFDPSAYTLSGVSVDVLYDSRDSTINPYRGLYAHLGYAVYPTWLGSSQTSTQLGAEFRAYVGLSDDVPRNVLAFWVIASGVTSGSQPYMALPSVGWDAKGTTGRGYVQGRFRGPSVVYAEAEWRFRITDNGFLGGAIFVNGETFSRPAVSLPAYGFSIAASNLFADVKPAGGVGLRFLMNKESRTNIRLDFGYGVDGLAIYLGAGEVF